MPAAAASSCWVVSGPREQRVQRGQLVQPGRRVQRAQLEATVLRGQLVRQVLLARLVPRALQERRVPLVRMELLGLRVQQDLPVQLEQSAQQAESGLSVRLWPTPGRVLPVDG